MSVATLQGRPVTHARVQLPAWGRWWVDCRLDDEAELEGQVELDVAGLRLAGTVVAGGASKGVSQYRIAAGRGGWGKAVSAKDYAADQGVKLATVLNEAASDAGEVLDLATVPSTMVGAKFVREGAPATAASVLEQLAPENWYVGEDGVTRIGKRPPIDYTGQATRGDLDVSRGTLELESDDVSALVPGIVVDGLEAVDVQHELDPKRLRTTIWGRGFAPTSRLLAAQKRLIAQLLTNYRLRGVFEYRVVSPTGERWDLQPVRVSGGLPSLRRVRVRMAAGLKSRFTLGSTVLVSFVDADPTRPVVVAGDDPESPGFRPGELTFAIGATGAEPWEHATSVEAVVALLWQTFVAIGAQSPGALTGAGLAGVSVAAINAAIAAVGAGAPVSTFLVALAAALEAKSADPTHQKPGVAWPSVRGA